jgi:hypothetical protein
MSLDFEDALCAARAGGWVAVGAFAMRALGDLAVSLPREWARTAELGFTAATAGLTALLWGLALRPWTWRDIQPRPPAHARSAPPATETELLVLAALALLPVVAVILFAGHFTRASRLAPDAGTRAKGTAPAVRMAGSRRVKPDGRSTRHRRGRSGQ